MSNNKRNGHTWWSFCTRRPIKFDVCMRDSIENHHTVYIERESRCGVRFTVLLGLHKICFCAAHTNQWFNYSLPSDNKFLATMLKFSLSIEWKRNENCKRSDHTTFMSISIRLPFATVHAKCLQAHFLFIWFICVAIFVWVCAPTLRWWVRSSLFVCLCIAAQTSNIHNHKNTDSAI